MTCAHIVKRDDKCNICSARGVAYCELPASSEFFVSEENCKLFEEGDK